MRTGRIIEAVAESINREIANKEENSFEAIADAKNETEAIYWARHQAHADQVSNASDGIKSKMEDFKVAIGDIEILMQGMVSSITNDGEELPLTIEFITNKKNEFKTFIDLRNEEVKTMLQQYQDSFTF